MPLSARLEQLSVKAWQTQLRRQSGRDQPFLIDKIGAEPVSSEFAVANPQSGSRYRVAIPGAPAGENYCSCPDFATNGKKKFRWLSIFNLTSRPPFQ